MAYEQDVKTGALRGHVLAETEKPVTKTYGHRQSENDSSGLWILPINRG